MEPLTASGRDLSLILRLSSPKLWFMPVMEGVIKVTLITGIGKDYVTQYTQNTLSMA